MNETIGERIRRERLSASLTQRDLAERVDVGVPHISKIEADRENPSDELLGRIAEVFGADPYELMITARRLPSDLSERLAANPAEALAFLRTFGASDETPGTDARQDG